MYVFIFYVLSYVATIDRLMRRTVLRLVPMLSNSLFAIRNSTCLPPHNPWPAILGNKAFLPDDYPKARDQCPWCPVAAKCCENPAVLCECCSYADYRQWTYEIEYFPAWQ
jgi:hypothetical protein